MSTDWHQMLVPSGSLLEVIVRGTLMYLGLFVMLRVILDRRSQGVSTPDVLLIVLIADAAQNGMAAEYRSITEGLVLVATILFWDYALDWITYRVPVIGRWIEPPALPLIRDGKLLRQNLRKELISIDELESMLREKGVEHYHSVRLAQLEPSGELSVLPTDTAKSA